MRLLLLVFVVACGPGLAKQSPKPRARELLAGDAATLEAMMQDSVTNGGLAFDDATCQRDFGAAGDVAPARFGAFARCLAGLHLTASEREDALPDVVVLQHAPGFELEARVTETGRLAWIGFASRTAGEPDVPTITAAALEGLRLAGDRAPAVASDLVDPELGVGFAWFKLCLDRAGAVTKAEPFETTSDGVSKAFGHALATWRFRPFVTRGAPIPVCTLVRLAYPADKAPKVETLPLPPPPSRSKKRPLVLANARLIEGRRISGEKAVVPDDADKMRIRNSPHGRWRGRFRVCVDDTGVVESVLPLELTGLPGYDRKLVAAIHDWRYTPYQVDDVPVPVCTQVTFVYAQR